MKVIKAIVKFIGAHKTRALSFVFVLVFFGSICLSTQTKYVSYVNTYSATNAGEFYFSSNYLADVEGTTYTISSWDTYRYSVAVQIRNYENSLLYNDVGFYYTVVGAMYKDADCTEIDENYKATITYPDSANAVTIDGITYGYLSGTSSFDDTSGQQSVTVKVESSYPISDTRYLKIVAYSIPTLPESTDSASTSTDDTSADDTSVDDTTASVTNDSVFYSELSATFILTNTSGSAQVSTTLAQNESNSEVQLRITCPEIAGATTQKLRIYFKTDTLDADSLTLPNATVSADYEGYSYSEITVSASSITTVLLFKKSSTTVSVGSYDTESDNNPDIFIIELSE